MPLPGTATKGMQIRGASARVHGYQRGIIATGRGL